MYFVCRQNIFFFIYLLITTYNSLYLDKNIELLLCFKAHNKVFLMKTSKHFASKRFPKTSVEFSNFNKKIKENGNFVLSF